MSKYGNSFDLVRFPFSVNYIKNGHFDVSANFVNIEMFSTFCWAIFRFADDKMIKYVYMRYCAMRTRTTVKHHQRKEISLLTCYTLLLSIARIEPGGLISIFCDRIFAIFAHVDFL